MTSLKMAFHSVTGRRMVEVYDGTGALVGVIYPHEPHSIHIVSKHFDGPPRDTVPEGDSVKGYLITFKPRGG